MESMEPIILSDDSDEDVSLAMNTTCSKERSRAKFNSRRGRRNNIGDLVTAPEWVTEEGIVNIDLTLGDEYFTPNDLMNARKYIWQNVRDEDEEDDDVSSTFRSIRSRRDPADSDEEVIDTARHGARDDGTFGKSRKTMFQNKVNYS